MKNETAIRRRIEQRNAELSELTARRDNYGDRNGSCAYEIDRLLELIRELEWVLEL